MATPDASPSRTPSSGKGMPKESPPRSAREEEKQKKVQGSEERRGSPSKTKTNSRASATSRRSQAQEKEEEEEKEEKEEGNSNSFLFSGSDFSRAIKPIQAFVRVKPTAHFAQDMIKFGTDNKSIDIHIEKDARGGIVNNSSTDWSFRMDGLLHYTSQDKVYETVARHLVAEALCGHNGTIMCYGQTGAGKTYTMTGSTTEYKHRGIIPRAIQQVFKAARESTTLLTSVRISYLEVYNEALFDLLGPGGSRNIPLAVLDSPQGVCVRGLSVYTVSNEKEALNLFFEGDNNRVIAEHALNKNSSRSHCIFTIYIECRSAVYTNLKGVKSKITLIDLAGSERLSEIESTGQIQKENSYINRSLTFLEQIILALADPSRGYIPFRQSKLTHVLKDSLGGNCNTVLVTNICGEAAHVEETLSSLRFATRLRWITAEPVPNVTFEPEVSVKALEEEIDLLKQELVLQDIVVNRCLVTYSPLTGVQRAAIKSQVHKYLRGAIEEIDIVSIRQIQEVFKQFKVIISQQEKDIEAKLRSKYLLGDKGESKADSGSGEEVEDEEKKDKKEKKDEAGGGDLGDGLVQEGEKLQREALETGTSSSSPVPGEKKEDKKSEEQIKKEKLVSPSLERDLDGSAPPETQEESPTKDVAEEEGASEQDRADSEQEPSSGKETQQPSIPPSTAQAFELFKQGAGSEISRIFKENKSILLARKRSSNSLARRINDIKREMEGVRETLEGKKRKRWQEGEYTDEEGQVIIDEKEFSLILKLKELKEEHRAGYAELQDLKAEIQHCQQLVDKCRKRLISEFEIWYNESFCIPEDVREALRPGGSIRPGMIPVDRVMCLDEDEQDKFERMQETNLPECPGSTPFYRARMKMEQQQTFDRTMSALQQMRRKPGIVTAAGKNKPPSFPRIM
ncbi:kinesin-like protein KIF9 isoform X2 [Neopelma chrysocephalum]|uniref:kinesin-like protein KIF9 isoform X2 n=1 Tax=Neopelma chrysocephalum TaxID=114329 RepID=UPI000FCD0D2C|nr:kinesin-like protein KIF9 isoform X2 [Neopelma chrysocephalum]